jgi:hypothetical protein
MEKLNDMFQKENGLNGYEKTPVNLQFRDKINELCMEVDKINELCYTLAETIKKLELQCQKLELSLEKKRDVEVVNNLKS